MNASSQIEVQASSSEHLGGSKGERIVASVIITVPNSNKQDVLRERVDNRVSFSIAGIKYPRKTKPRDESLWLTAPQQPVGPSRGWVVVKPSSFPHGGLKQVQRGEEAGPKTAFQGGLLP